MAIKKSVRHPMLTWARVADTLECTGIYLNSLRATYWAVRRDLWTQRWKPGNSHSSTCHQCNPSVRSTGTTYGCHPPRRCWSGTGGPRGEGIASSPSGTAQADRIISRERRKGNTQGITDPCALQTLRSAVLIHSVSSTSRENTHLGLAFNGILLHSSLRTLGSSGDNLLWCSTPRVFWTGTWRKAESAVPFCVTGLLSWSSYQWRLTLALVCLSQGFMLQLNYQIAWSWKGNLLPPACSGTRHPVTNPIQAHRRLILYKLKHINKLSAKLLPSSSSEKQLCKACVLVQQQLWDQCSRCTKLHPLSSMQRKLKSSCNSCWALVLGNARCVWSHMALHPACSLVSSLCDYSN